MALELPTAADHERFMRHALAAARNAPALPFGAVIVDRPSGEIVVEGWNRSALNATWHGEIDALGAFFRSGSEIPAARLALYTTAEPCPMCMSAILWSGLGLVVFGTSILFLQQAGWQQIDIRAEEVIHRSPGFRCTLLGGILEAECNPLFAGGPPRA